MGRMLEAACSFPERSSWVLSPLEEGSMLRLAYSGDIGEFVVLIRAREDANQLIVYSVCPIEVERDMRAAVGGYLMRLNWGMPFGNFELHYATGEIRFRTSMTIENAEATDSLVRPLIYANVNTMDRYLKEIGAVAAGTLPPDLADSLG
ncbi:MAG: hypothetical protein JWO62_3616 [Acidimicrobiaceae bacterium]|nr:hypothetical protein [Acidimicrobiaceae bacterium]